MTYPSGCHVCEVEVDPETGSIHSLRYVSVDDIGSVFDPVFAAAQLHGGATQGLGQARMEACVYHAETGQLVNGSLLDYALPRAEDAADFEALFLDPAPGESFRGVGEMGTICATPAIANALIDALDQDGVDHIDIPISPECLWLAFHSRKSV